MIFKYRFILNYTYCISMNQIQSYWSKNDQYENECKILDTFVPDQGEATDERIEMYRIARNVYYDIHNNGGCNLTEGWARNQEYMTLVAKFPNQKLEEYMEIYEAHQNSLNSDDGEYVSEPSDCLYDEACQACDQIINQVVEWIKSTGFFEEVKA